MLPDPRPGIFNAPVAIQVVAQIFDSVGRLDRLQKFMSGRSEEFYDFPTRSPLWQFRRTIELAHQPWKVPDDYGGIVPFLAGETLQWRVVG
jgi:dihydroorotase